MNVMTMVSRNTAALTAKTLMVRYGLLALMLAMLITTATAGTGGGTTGFATMLTTVVGWANGDLGKLLAVSAFLVGMGIGIVKQSMIAIALGIGFALALAYGPDLITSIFTFAI